MAEGAGRGGAGQKMGGKAKDGQVQEGSPWKGHKKLRLHFGGGETAMEVAVQTIRASLEAARRHEAGVIAGRDPEFLHGYRISLRRSRSVLSLFKGVFAADAQRQLKAEFASLMAPTGRLRDLDVFLLERPFYSSFLPEALQPGLEPLFAAIEADRTAAQADLARHLESGEYRRKAAALAAALETPGAGFRGARAGDEARAYGRGLIWKRYRRICKGAAGLTDGTPDSEVHELRIACKKLRYLMEVFEPLLPGKSVKVLLKPLKRLQDNLGRFNDCSVQQAALQHFLQEHEEAGGMDMAQCVGGLTAVLYRRQRAERALVSGNLGRLAGAGMQAKVRALCKRGGGRG
ncbi:CHAD domain-containing protein [Roseobacteraceae bacterium NS-SX3]